MSIGAPLRLRLPLLFLAFLAFTSVSFADKVFRKKAPKQQPPLCLVKLKPNEQCGGTGGNCAKYRYDLKKCQDAPYQKACCPRGYACLRYSESWRDCKPVKLEKPKGLPPLSKIPKKSELPKPVYINSKVIVNGRPKHRYLLLKYLTDWYTAEAICQYYYNLHLASIHDVGELWRVNNRCFAQMRDMCWVGANDLQYRNIFRWTDGSSWDFAFWQQNGGTSTNPRERCVALQDGFQTWPCNTKWAIACQVY